MEHEKDVTNKTLKYILETLDVLIKNEEHLLSRTKKVEEAIEVLAGHLLDEIQEKKEDRTIN